MRAARIHGARDVRLHDEPAPKAGPGEALVRIEAVGICGSDLHWYEEGGIGGTKVKGSLVPGHEFAGRTEDGRLVAVDDRDAPGVVDDAVDELIEAVLARGGTAQLVPDGTLDDLGRVALLTRHQIAAN